MDSGPTPASNFGNQQSSLDSDKEKQLQAKKDKNAKQLEDQRIRNMRGRGGAASLLSAGDMTGNNILG